MTFNNIVSGDTVFIGSREDINHLSPETPETIQLQTRAEPPLLSVLLALSFTINSEPISLTTIESLLSEKFFNKFTKSSPKLNSKRSFLILLLQKSIFFYGL